MVGQIPIMFVSRAILTSEKQGPSHGTLAFFRDIDDHFLGKLSKELKFNLSLILPSQPEYQVFVKKLSDQNPYQLQRQDKNVMNGYVLINDHSEHPAFIFKVPMNRDIAQEAIKTRYLILIYLLVISIVFGILFILYLNKVLLNRVFNMSQQIQKLPKLVGSRLSTLEKDELSEIGKTVNTMLDKLDANREDLELAKKEAESASQAKSQFLANMSHEIRTPLNAILGFSDLLRRTSMNEEQLNYLETITTSGQLLASVINDILDISKIEAGKVQLEKIDFDLHLQLEQSINISKSKIHGKNVEMVLDIDPQLPKYFEGDSTRLQQIVVNLLSNAAKFTKQGRITLFAKRRKELDNSSQDMMGVWVGVQDTGIGIPKDKIGLLFMVFTQADVSTTRKFGGTGLGLAISKSLVELMGGRIWVESEEGKGSCFQFELPLRVGHSFQEKAQDKEKVDIQGVKLLVVEDSKPNQDLMKAYFKMMGVVAEFANNGKQAVEHLRLKKDYLLILMDMQMPVMDGIEATRIIRAEIDRDIPIVALTAAVFKEDQDNCLRAGMNGFLTKPIDIKKLKSAIINYINKK